MSLLLVEVVVDLAHQEVLVVEVLVVIEHLHLNQFQYKVIQ